MSSNLENQRSRLNVTNNIHTSASTINPVFIDDSRVDSPETNFSR